MRFPLPWPRRAGEREMREELEALRAMAEPRELGNFTRAAENASEAWGWTWMDRLAQDLRYAARSLTAVAVLASIRCGPCATSSLTARGSSLPARPKRTS